jgi:molybdopterin-binding protein
MDCALPWQRALANIAVDRRRAVSAIRRPECASGTVIPQEDLSARAAPSRNMRHLRNTMRISARNQIKGKILEVKKGATTAHIRLEIAPGQVITSSITNEAVDDLGLKVGATATAVIKASDVMIAID